MALSKTEQGRNALEAQSAAGLSLPERRVLILCDGRRNRKDIVALLGANALPMIDRLLQAGYLSSHGGSASGPKPVASPRRNVTTASTSVKKTPVHKPATPTSQRSLAVSRMYLADMLQLQRDPESALLRTEIQTCPGEDELVYHMMRALRHLQEIAAANVARRVGERLGEILPERYLPRLDYIRKSWLETTSAVA